jgi:prolipoprotein diacylglyceryltransferase
MNSAAPHWLALLPFLFFIPFLVLALLGLAFWIWMLVDCATHEPSQGNDKVVWILIIVLTHVIGALIYFLVRRPQRKAQFGG